MLTQKAGQYGMTLIEVILTLTIASAILLMGIRQYQVIQRENYVQQIKYNVDTLFQAAAYYYYANCHGGSLDYNNLSPTTLWWRSYRADITNDLINPGYLRYTIPSNPLINGTGPAGYIVQFNVNTVPRTVCTTTNCATPTTIGTNVLWTIQVSAILRDPTTIQSFSQLTNADCISSPMSAGTIASCGSASSFATYCLNTINYINTHPFDIFGNMMRAMFAGWVGCSMNANNYNTIISWERAPSMALPNAKPTLWQTMPAVKQFKQQYETYPMSTLITTSHSPEFQYFQCGS